MQYFSSYKWFSAWLQEFECIKISKINFPLELKFIKSRSLTEMGESKRKQHTFERTASTARLDKAQSNWTFQVTFIYRRETHFTLMFHILFEWSAHTHVYINHLYHTHTHILPPSTPYPHIQRQFFSHLHFMWTKWELGGFFLHRKAFNECASR